MENHKIFKLIWRFNSVIIGAAGLLAILVLIFGLYQIIRDTTGEHAVQDTVNVEGDAGIEENWRLGYMQSITGTPHVMMPLTSEQNYRESYYEKSTDPTRNYLFVNSLTNQQQWLFPTNEQMITRMDLLTSSRPVVALDEGAIAPPSSNLNNQTEAILYTVVPIDSNEDGRLTEQDLKTIALSQPNGRGYKELLTEVDVVIGHQLADAETLLVIYQREDVGYSARIQLEDFSVMEEAQLSNVDE